jgi:hypothetical protein
VVTTVTCPGTVLWVRCKQLAFGFLAFSYHSRFQGDPSLRWENGSVQDDKKISHQLQSEFLKLQFVPAVLSVPIYSYLLDIRFIYGLSTLVNLLIYLLKVDLFQNVRSDHSHSGCEIPTYSGYVSAPWLSDVPKLSLIAW